MKVLFALFLAFVGTANALTPIIIVDKHTTIGPRAGLPMPPAPAPTPKKK